jgi:predicted nucleotidyltransferase
LSVLTAIFPRVRAEILRLLFADPSRELHLRELARLSGLAFGTLQGEVRKLSAADLLTSRRDGNRLYFRANASHPVFPELQALALKTTGLREQLVDALAGLGGVDLAFVFGSAATGAFGAASDIDLMVVGPTGLRAISPRLRAVAERTGREVNPHVLAAPTLAAKARAGDVFISNVLAAPKMFVVGNADELAAMV